MLRLHTGLCAVLACALLTSGQGRAQVAEGNWLFKYVSGGTVEQAVAIVKLQQQGGKVTGELVAGAPSRVKTPVPPPPPVLQSVAIEGGTLRVVLKLPNAELHFEGAVPAAGAKTILGAAFTDTLTFPASLSLTTETAIDMKDVTRLVDCPPLQQARTLSQRSLLLRFQASQNKDAEKKKALLQQATEADQAAKKATPKLYREVLAKFPQSPATLDAALNLIRGAAQGGAMPDEVKSWATTAMSAAKSYGPRWQAEVAGQLAAVVINQEGLAPLGLELAKQGEAQLSASSPAAAKAKALTLLATALRKNGKEAEAKALDQRLSAIEGELDKEYLAKVPPFKGTPFAGRQSKSDRAVFMELFTGATCPPCVAADVAFDVLAKNYKAKDLVLIQYHVHIPGPDPMTNPDTEARWRYYQKAYPTEVRGVPSSVFNGQPKAGGGGAMANAEKKYETYCQVINPLLEQPAGAKITAHAVRKGSKVAVDVAVSELMNPGPSKKLRILLVEETVRFAGSNKIRFHHHVVRAMLGGAEGHKLSASSAKHAASIDLDTLRSDLNKYLDNYHANVRPLPSPNRPMDFNNLRIVAFVQDDDTHEILQVTQVEVEGKGGR